MPSLAAPFADLFAPLQTITYPAAFARLVLALLLSAAIGWEREIKSRSAGLRTHMLIAVAACMFTLVAMELTHFPAQDPETLRVDPLRLIEAVTAGVAFLAAGSIITSGRTVRGVTTGASMWLAGAVGLACGTGDGSLAVMGTGLALVVLWLVRLMAEPLKDKVTGPDRGPKQTGDGDQ